MELIVYDRQVWCPYLPRQVARMPLRMPTRDLTGEELDERLAVGDRRQGVVLYRTRCPRCEACEPVRIDVARFRPTRTHRRTLARGLRELAIEIGRPRVDAERVALYDRHKRARALADDAHPIEPQTYEEFLVATCCDSLEIAYRLNGELVGVAITDRGAISVSAVYCHHDPTKTTLGVGTFSILYQLELCKQWGLRWLYLGLYVAGNDPMAYKARFLPHERRIDGRWQVFEKAPAEPEAGESG